MRAEAYLFAAREGNIVRIFNFHLVLSNRHGKSVRLILPFFRLTAFQISELVSV